MEPKLRVLLLRSQIKTHMIQMYANPEYWYLHYCDELHTNHLLNLEFDLIKKVTRNELSINLCLSKFRTLQREFDVKTEGFFYPKLEPLMINSMHSLIIWEFGG